MSDTTQQPATAAEQACERTAAAPREPAAGRRVETWLLATLVSLAVIYTLAIAQKFFVPVTLAFLLSLVLAPIVRWLAHHHVPRTLSAGIVVLALVSAFSYGIAGSIEPVSHWVEQAPRILRQLEREVYPIKKTVEEVSRTAEQVDRIATFNTEQTVEIKGLSFRDIMYANARGLITSTVVATFLLYFILSWGSEILIRVSNLLANHHRKHRLLELSLILEGEVSKYLFTITVINLSLGAVVAAVLYAFEMPNPLLWGAVAGVLNFIPYLGSLVTMVLLGATALLTFKGLAMPALIVAAFTGLTVLEGQVVTPLVLGKRLALNPLVVFLSVVFWFWLWGVMGALMAVPMLITLKLAGDRVQSLRPLAVVAGRQVP
ncbi:MAG TPA: AI-2E family transporter [Gammaproteobacteria bacterium]|nr:AI-2E family transporter [Gammaproteobacteria bacterium]